MRRRLHVAVVGGGIAGLAHAYVAAKNGHTVVVFERQPRASGASVRNFGLIWPIGQPPGARLQMALRSRQIWKEVLGATGLPVFETGSLHVVYREDEAAVAREFAERAPDLGYQCRWMNRDEALATSAALQPEGLLGGLFSATEMTVDPRLVVAALPAFLAERHGVALRYGCAVQEIAPPCVRAGGESFFFDQVIVCAGDDFESLFPRVFAGSGITRCKLQMMRTAPQPDGWCLGPALAAGLTLRFYPSFTICATLPRLRLRIEQEMPEYARWDIHVMASQTPAREVTIGDSHEYGLAVDAFDKPEVDALILRYLRTFLQLPVEAIAQRWHGVYAKHAELPFFTASPLPGVTIVTALGGAGMTLSFGLAEHIWQELDA